MKPTLILALICVLIRGACAAETAPADQVRTAVTAIKAATNYSWTTTLKIANSPFDPGPIKGQTEKAGFAMVTQQLGDNNLEAVFKGDKIVMKREGHWETPDPSDFFMSMAATWITRMGPAGDEAASLIARAKELKADNGALAGDLSEAGVKELLNFGPRDGGFPPPTNAHGSVRFWLKDGALVKFESHLAAKMVGPNQESFDFDMTRTTAVEAVGSTKVGIPAEAKHKLESK
jgi:hypothetical protein